jgi:hypothetical protein
MYLHKYIFNVIQPRLIKIETILRQKKRQQHSYPVYYHVHIQDPIHEHQASSAEGQVHDSLPRQLH